MMIEVDIFRVALGLRGKKNPAQQCNTSCQRKFRINWNFLKVTFSLLCYVLLVFQKMGMLELKLKSVW